MASPLEVTESLRLERMNVINQLQVRLDELAGQEWSEEDKATLDRMEARIAELNQQIEFRARNEQRANEAAALREAQAVVFGEPAPAQRGEEDPDAYLRSFIRKARDGQGTGPQAIEVSIYRAAKEMELVRQGASPQEIRALAWDTGSAASLVPSSVSRTLYQYMEASNGFMNAPTTRIVTTSGEAIPFPKLGAHAIATQVSGQGTTLAGTDPTFLKMTLDAFKYGELVIVSNEFISDSVVDPGTFLAADLGRALGRAIDTDLVTGSGSGKPNGIMTAITGSGTIATGGSLITPTVEKMIDLQYSVADTYRNSPACAWLMNDSTAGTLRKLRDGAGGTVGAFLWQPSLTMGVIGGQPDRFLDKPVYTDSNVAAQASNAKTVAFGDMSAYYVRTVGNVVIESDSSRYFDTDQTGFRAKWRVDGDLIDASAVNCIKQNV